MEQHILIIEDDRTLNAGIAFALEKEGYAVHSALSLLEAEKRLDRKMNLILYICLLKNFTNAIKCDIL